MLAYMLIRLFKRPDRIRSFSNKVPYLNRIEGPPPNKKSDCRLN